jgi:U3 small nucleolar RNA-associated protein 25
MATTDFDDMVTTKLLTLLNTSATKVRKRKCDFDDSLALPPVKKMGGKRVVVPNVEEGPKESEQEPKGVGKEGTMVEINDGQNAESATGILGPDDPFNAHFGASSMHLTDVARRNVEGRQWKSSSRSCGKLGSAVLQIPEDVNEDAVNSKVTVRPGSDDIQYPI